MPYHLLPSTIRAHACGQEKRAHGHSIERLPCGFGWAAAAARVTPATHAAAQPWPQTFDRSADIARSAMGASHSAQAYDGPQEVASKLGRRSPCLLAFMSPQCGLCASLRPALEQVGSAQGSRRPPPLPVAARCPPPSPSPQTPARTTQRRSPAAETTGEACRWRCSTRSWTGSGRQRCDELQRCGCAARSHVFAAAHTASPPDPPASQMLAYSVDTVPCFVLLGCDGEAAVQGRCRLLRMVPAGARLPPRGSAPSPPQTMPSPHTHSLRASAVQDAGATGAAADGSRAASHGAACGRPAAGAAAPLSTSPALRLALSLLSTGCKYVTRQAERARREQRGRGRRVAARRPPCPALPAAPSNATCRRSQRRRRRAPPASWPPPACAPPS